MTLSASRGAVAPRALADARSPRVGAHGGRRDTPWSASAFVFASGFAAVPSLIQKKIDAVPAFWNAEGVILRRRGVPTREFRVDDFGAPRYPEVVLFTTRTTLKKRRRMVQGVVRALTDGTKSVLADPGPAVREIARAGGADEELVRAQLEAVSPALRPPLSLNRKALERWADFDKRFGILEHRLDVQRAFAFDLTE